MGEDVLESIFSGDDQCPCIMELRGGLKKVGIYQIGRDLPIFLHLLRPGPSQDLTVRIVTNLLKPAFSEEGTNSRKFENEVYELFMKYLRVAGSGRRGVISLAHVLQFATGTDEEPVLGFVLHPSLRFVEAIKSAMASHKGTSVDEPVRKVAWVHVMTASRSVQPDDTLEEIHQEPLESQCTKNLPETG
ncbi:hypothetical protein OS493_017528 [Desmophyllum pertusum]|uniref:Uncharacterized protein n=1 Tax=Desmophyllum pertusum TaxID=174260 RepID=A0A9X0D2U3_9CNID|nr:hypothetical protein OS493_017528 [Desmophyllum pertusum]